jgi:hypothetical protein
MVFMYRREMVFMYRREMVFMYRREMVFMYRRETIVTYRTEMVVMCRREMVVTYRTETVVTYRCTTVYVPSLELGPPTPSLASECAALPGTKGGVGHTRLQVRGCGSPNSDDWRKSLALCLYSVDASIGYTSV